MKKITFIFCALLLVSQLASCSSPEEKAADYIANADTLFEEGDFTKAEIEYKNALQVNQNLPDAWYGLARIHERRQEWRQAYGALSRIRDVNPNHVNGRIMLGQILLASNQIDQALQDAKEVLELAPRDPRAHALMAAVQFRLGNNEASMTSVEQALAIDSTNNEATLVKARVLIADKKYDQALTVLDQAIQANPENVSLYMMKIQAYGDSDNQNAIESTFKTLVEKFPKNVGFSHALARYYMEAKQTDKAEQVLEAIVASNPDNVDEKNRLVTFKSQLRSVEEAISLLKRYIDQDKSQFQFRFKLGELYEKSQQPEEASSVYRAIVDDDELQPNGLEARNKLALLELRAGRQDTARAYIDEVLANDKTNENALLLQAGFKINDGQYGDAIVDLRTVLRDNPNSIKALGLLGQAYTATGAGELAVDSYTKAFALNPAAPAIANQLAGILMRQNNAQRADEVLQESIKRGNNSVDALKLMTQVKILLGDWSQAERLAQQLKDVEGQEALSQQAMGIIFQGKEQQSESIEAFKRAHELAPESSRPLAALVQTYVKNNKVDEARKFLDLVIKENSDNVAAYLLLGQINLLEKKPVEAIANFDQIIKINPKLDIGYRSLSAVYARQNRLDEAEKVLIRGVEAIPENSNLAITLASLYERQRAFDKAIARYESLLEKNPDLIIARNNLASLLTDYRSDQESHDRARRISAEFKDSGVPQFRDTYAWAAVKTGINLEEAVVILEGVVKENTEVGVYHFHLGEAYRAKGDRDNAIAYLEKAIGLEQAGSDIARQAKESLQQLKQ